MYGGKRGVTQSICCAWPIYTQETCRRQIVEMESPYPARESKRKKSDARSRTKKVAWKWIPLPTSNTRESSPSQRESSPPCAALGSRRWARRRSAASRASKPREHTPGAGDNSRPLLEPAPAWKDGTDAMSSAHRLGQNLSACLNAILPKRLAREASLCFC